VKPPTLAEPYLAWSVADGRALPRLTMSILYQLRPKWVEIELIKRLFFYALIIIGWFIVLGRTFL
jgi:hypothetical protein